MFNTIFITAYLAAARAAQFGTLARVIRKRDERGQASAEYALVLLGAALLAIMLAGWLTKSDTLKKVFTELLDTILGNMPKPAG
ncbi:MAG TPA: DUF4244 domain-containing protein [Acidimicrobiales bacterium]|nr:DUF4244 domain-containing protein [Acidimicrobiales bacterium]